ncbi:MAG: response regulator [Pirellulaceae bacterium]
MTKTLLVADDAMIIRELIKDAAAEAGWRVLGEAANGRQAYEQYRQLRPDVVTLDMVMPEFDGLFALKHILDEDPDARVVVVSALDQKQVLTDAFKLGAADFLVKPFQSASLMETLNKVAR